MRFSHLVFGAAVAAVSLATSAVADTAAPACKTGSVKENTALVKNYYKATASGDAALMASVLADDYRSEPVAPGAPTGAKAAIESMKFVQATFAPLTINNVEFVTSGNKVVVRSDITVTHNGPFVGVAPTGRTLKFGAIDIHTVCNGKIVLAQHVEDWLSVLFQLGVLPIKQ